MYKKDKKLRRMNDMGSESSLLGGVHKDPPMRRAVKPTVHYDTVRQATHLALTSLL